MQTLFDMKAIAKELQGWEQSDAEIWEYSASNGQLRLRLKREASSEMLWVVCDQCRFVSGPSSWKYSRVRLFTTLHDGEHGILVFDEQIGFLVHCGIVRVAHQKGFGAS